MAAGAGILAQGSPAWAAPGAEPALPLDRPFRREALDALAADLAKRPYVAPQLHAGPTAGLDYDAWARIAFKSQRALWAADSTAFRMDYFPVGYLFRRPVGLFEVDGGEIRAIRYDPRDFDAPDAVVAALEGVADASGFRLQSPINRPGVFDEIAVFQGASYFRSLGQGEGYGLSARGISLGSGHMNEEFPAFRAFWIEKPAAGQALIVVHALLDGPSLTGAYRFEITPGNTTVFAIEAALHPRRDIDNSGLATQTSMFLFGAQDRRGIDDFRGEVHDSDGLEIWTGTGDRIWRPLTRPGATRFSAFEDVNPRGFGLSQRNRDFDDYNDLEARYDRRPSLWVEPVGDWGAGAVHLVELTAKHEGIDNIAAFWRPAAPMLRGKPFHVAYNLHWGGEPAPASPLARVVATRAGQADNPLQRRFVVDFGNLPPGAADARAELTATAGEFTHVGVRQFPDQPLIRTSFEFTPPASGSADLRLRLIGGGGDYSESWRFPWTS